MNEFDIINDYFLTRARPRADVVLGIGDDAAIVSVPENKELVVTTDTLIEAVHFVKNTAAFDVGFKSLAVNLSDLAAMGATPQWVTLALSFPTFDPTWLNAFCDGFFSLAERYNVQLIGGDLTRGSLSITITALGVIEKGLALRRSTAEPGDFIYVTGEFGAAGFALQTLLDQKPLPDPEAQRTILSRLNRPSPRVEIGKTLLPFANACIDISDGLIQDLEHILTQSQVGAEINVDAIPISPIVRRYLTPDDALKRALTAGDEYELCFTIPPEKNDSFQQLSQQFSCTSTLIGTITPTKNLHLHHQDGTPYHAQLKGFTHF